VFDELLLPYARKRKKETKRIANKKGSLVIPFLHKEKPTQSEPVGTFLVHRCRAGINEEEESFRVDEKKKRRVHQSSCFSPERGDIQSFISHAEEIGISRWSGAEAGLSSK